MNDQLGLSSPPVWNFYDGGDAPDGAFMGWLFGGTMQLTGRIPLPRTLPAGTYNTFIKVISYSGDVGRITVHLGSANTEVSTINRDWNRYWCDPARITATAAFSYVNITLRKTIAPAETQKYLVRGIYITPNLNENFDLYGVDRIVDYTVPAVMDDSPAVKGNLLQNGGFEVRSVLL
jgi:hypothetical protein